jgi:predicted MFS family arabinose efflux permease
MMRLFVETLQYVWTSPLFKPFIVLMFFLNLSSLVPNAPSFTYYFTEREHFSSAGYGSIISLFAAMGLVGYVLSSELYRRLDFSEALVRSALWQALLGTACLFFVRTPLMLAAVFGLSRVATSVLTMGTFLLRQTRVPKSRMGSANSCIRMFFMLGAPFSALLQAFLIQKFGVEASFIVGAACLWATWWFGRNVAEVYRQGTGEEASSPSQAA